MFHSVNTGISTFFSTGRKNDSLTILRKMKFSEMAVRCKKGIKPESLLPSEVLPRSIAWEFIYKSYTGKSQDTTKNLTGWGWKTAKDHLELWSLRTRTEQVSLVFCKLFRSILKIFNIDNTYSGSSSCNRSITSHQKIIYFRLLQCDSLALLSFQLSTIGPYFYLQAPAPDELMNTVHFNCKQSWKNQCGSNLRLSRKNDLPYMSAWRGCCGTICYDGTVY